MSNRPKIVDLEEVDALLADVEEEQVEKENEELIQELKFDKNGNIVAMQSSTANIDLGFGDMQINGKYMPEQYLNVGLGPSVGSIVKQLDHFGVKYKSESDDDGYRIIG